MPASVKNPLFEWYIQSSYWVSLGDIGDISDKVSSILAPHWHTDVKEEIFRTCTTTRASKITAKLRGSNAVDAWAVAVMNFLQFPSPYFLHYYSSS
jgi:hypothetical protein